MKNSTCLLPFWICFVALWLGVSPAFAAQRFSNIEKYLSETQFISGYKAPEKCESALLTQALASMKLGVPGFRRLELSAQVRQVHEMSHMIFIEQVKVAFRALKGWEDTRLIVTPKQLMDLSVRLKVLGQAPIKDVMPFGSELTAISFEIGSLIHFAHRFDPAVALNFIEFYKKVLSIPGLRGDWDRVFAVSAASSLVVLHSSLIAKSKDPEGRVTEALKVLVDASRGAANIGVVEPLLHASFLASTHAVSAFNKVPVPRRAAYVRMVENLFLGGAMILENIATMGDQNSNDVDVALSQLKVLSALPELKNFPQIAENVKKWGRLNEADPSGRAN